MKFTVHLDPSDEGGFVAHCLEIPGAISEGDSREQALGNIKDAIAQIIAVRRQKADAHPGQVVTVDVAHA